MEKLTEARIKEILESPGTHFVVQKALDLFRDKDPVDAYHDALLVAEILKTRMEIVLSATSFCDG